MEEIETNTASFVIEYWQLTGRLRWASIWKVGEVVRIALQQEWNSVIDDKLEWRDVPTGTLYSDD